MKTGIFEIFGGGASARKHDRYPSCRGTGIGVCKIVDFRFIIGTLENGRSWMLKSLRDSDTILSAARGVRWLGGTPIFRRGASLVRKESQSQAFRRLI